MKFSVNKSVFLSSLASIVGITKGKVAFPILGMVRIEAADGVLNSRTTNTEIDMVAKCAADVLEPGVMCVSAVQLHDIVSAAPKGLVDFSIDGSWLIVRAGRAMFRLVTSPSAEFPVQAEADVPSAKMLAKDAKWMLAGVAKSVSTDDVRYNLCGVYVESNGERLRFVASDGHRLSLREMKWSGPVASAIVPAEAIRAAGEMEDLSFGLNAQRVVFSGTHIALTARCIEGKFPDYELVIPTQHKGTVMVNRLELVEAVKRVLIMAVDRARTIRLRHDDNAWCIEAVTPQLGEARERVDVQSDGTIVEIGVNGSYLLDALNAIDTDQALFSMGDNQSPIVVTPNDVANTKHVIMPIKI